MRIAVYYNLNFGGAKRVIFEQVKWLAKKKHKIDLYLITKDEDIFDPIKYSENVYRYPYQEKLTTFNIFNKLQKDASVFLNLKNLHKKIAKDIDSRNYDLVFVHPDKFTQAPYLLRFLKTISVYYCQEPLRIAYEYSLRFKDKVSFYKKAYEQLNRLTRKNIDLVNVRAATNSIASCYHVRERMIESYDVYPRVCYPGIDHNVFRPLKTKKSNQVMFIGDKSVVTDGYDLAFESLRLIPAKIRPKLKIISWKKNNKERLSDEDLVKLYNESIAVFCLSRLETFGLVPLEAMSCGIPVIATKISGHRETVLEDKTGYLVDFQPKEIARKLVGLINNRNICEQMGKDGRKLILEKWTWEVCNKELETILKEISLGKSE
jgi:glycosyltransferase involved in cell wall biosynthesis